jgi:hypothetical protein
MKYYITVIICIISVNPSIIGQTKTDCFEIKYLDFFGIENTEEIKWPPSELDPLLLEDYTKFTARKTNFLIPLIVFQLKDYHPSCPKQKDTSIYRKLLQLYSKIRQHDFLKLTVQPVSSQLEFIRQDYYNQVLNDSLLPFMNSTVDDGPFYGLVSEFIPNYKEGQSKKTDFGKIFITKNAGKNFITVVNKEGRHLWTRIMTRDAGYPLPDIIFSEKEIVKTSLGYRIIMFAGGEALNLYLKSNGEFRFYFHSW